MKYVLTKVLMCKLSLIIASDFAKKPKETKKTNQEIRNGNCSRLMAVLTQSRTFSCATHAHLSVGHTHEDIDAILSVVRKALDSESVLLTPRDFMRAIDKKLEPLFKQQGMDFKTFWVEQVPLFQHKLNLILFCISRKKFLQFFRNNDSDLIETRCAIG